MKVNEVKWTTKVNACKENVKVKLTIGTWMLKGASVTKKQLKQVHHQVSNAQRKIRQMIRNEGNDSEYWPRGEGDLPLRLVH